MKKSFFIVILASIMLVSCTEEESNPLSVDFTAEVTGKSPNAQVSITNKSSGATNYQWSFGEGASDSVSVKEIPEDLTVDKAGDLKITLVADDGSTEEELTKTITIEGYTAIKTYTGIEFALEGGDSIYGRYFSFDTEKMYLDSAINEDNGPEIHLAFSSMASMIYHFDSPNDEDHDIPNATHTKITNYEEDPTISLEDFDMMDNDSSLVGLTINHDEESFGNSTIPHTVLFETAEGQKGVIKTKEINEGRMLVDIKIQKY